MLFEFDLTIEKVTKLIPKAIGGVKTWHDSMLEVFPEYDIISIPRVAAFIGQCSHESNGFRVLEENLNYSAQGLTRTWPSRFPSGFADSYARKPQAIANRAYSNRMGNGDEESGDGWRFRGRGIIQLTGKSNYTECSNFLFNDETLVNTPDLLFDPYYAIHSACWFWSKNKLNSLADASNIVDMTKRINGGLIGLEERQHLFDQAVLVLSGN